MAIDLWKLTYSNISARNFLMILKRGVLKIGRVLTNIPMNVAEPPPPPFVPFIAIP